jgi:hypothetical protein
MRLTFREDLTREVPRILQPVEKVVVGPVGRPKELEKQGQNTTKTSFSAPGSEAEESAKEFFNTLERFWAGGML